MPSNDLALRHAITSQPVAALTNPIHRCLVCSNNNNYMCLLPVCSEACRVLEVKKEKKKARQSMQQAKFGLKSEASSTVPPLLESLSRRRNHRLHHERRHHTQYRPAGAGAGAVAGSSCRLLVLLPLHDSCRRRRCPIWLSWNPTDTRRATNWILCAGC